MRVQCLTHVPFEGLGSIAPWLAAASHEIVHTRLYEQAPLPAPAQVDLLVVMGGPMSVHDEQEYSPVDGPAPGLSDQAPSLSRRDNTEK